MNIFASGVIFDSYNLYKKLKSLLVLIMIAKVKYDKHRLVYIGFENKIEKGTWADN